MKGMIKLKYDYLGKEDFDLKTLKRDDILVTFNNDKYLYTANGTIVDLKKIVQSELSDIVLEIKSISRSGIIIARRNRWKKNLKRSRKYDRNSKTSIESRRKRNNEYIRNK